MNDEIIIDVSESDGKNIVFKMTFFTEYLQGNSEINSLIESFFGATDFFSKQISEAENKTTFIIKTKQEKVIDFFNVCAKYLKQADDGILGYVYDNKN